MVCTFSTSPKVSENWLSDMHPYLMTWYKFCWNLFDIVSVIFIDCDVTIYEDKINGVYSFLDRLMIPVFFVAMYVKNSWKILTKMLIVIKHGLKC